MTVTRPTGPPDRGPNHTHTIIPGRPRTASTGWTGTPWRTALPAHDHEVRDGVAVSYDGIPPHRHDEELPVTEPTVTGPPTDGPDHYHFLPTGDGPTSISARIGGAPHSHRVIGGTTAVAGDPPHAHERNTMPEQPAEPAKREPKAEMRVLASNLRQMYVALIDEGFTRADALIIIGQAIAAAAGKGGGS